jgi:hypothetical protein
MIIGALMVEWRSIKKGAETPGKSCREMQRRMWKGSLDRTARL